MHEVVLWFLWDSRSTLFSCFWIICKGLIHSFFSHRHSNCNGIVGVNPETGIPYEQEFCGSTPPRGFAVLGDSAAAHFHVPPQYLEPGAWDPTTFNDILMILENEFDWPMTSAYTGFMNTTVFNPSIEGPVNSSYLVMNNRNKCNHRDFQNIGESHAARLIIMTHVQGVNGARASSVDGNIKYALARNMTDYPMTVFIALIGNDVCNGCTDDTLSCMTTEHEMYESTLGSLEYLDTILPPGSDVVLMGLADGRILYEAMANRTHPLGMWFNNMDYTALYNYLNCLQISPCSGWMNSNGMSAWYGYIYLMITFSNSSQHHVRACCQSLPCPPRDGREHNVH